MRHFFSLLLLLCTLASTVAFSKSKLAPTSLHPDDGGAWTFEKVIDIAGADKTALYNTMQSWVLANIKTDDTHTQTADANHDKIVTNVTLALGNLWTLYTDVTLNFKLILEFKDNKMRVTATSFSYAAVGTSSNLGIINSPLESYEAEKGIIKKIDERIDEKFPAFIASLEKGAAQKKSLKDW